MCGVRVCVCVEKGKSLGKWVYAYLIRKFVCILYEL